MIKKIFYLSLLFLFPASFLFSRSEMTFYFGKKGLWRASFVYTDSDECYMYLINKSKSHLANFSKLTLNDDSFEVFAYGENGMNDIKDKVVLWLEHERKLKNQKLSHTSLQKIKRRILSEKAQERTIEFIARKIKDKSVVMYTGAGISASVVPTMALLRKSAQFPSYFADNSEIMSFMKSVAKDPVKLHGVFKNFFSSCKYGIPTKAHHAIALLANKKKWKLMTENIDSLHKKTNISYFGRGCNGFGKPDLKKAEILLTVGLGTDDRGLLYQFKEKNPDGQIIALNLEQPYFLGKSDIFVKGDVQKTAPMLADLVLSS